ncbi:MAG: cobalt transporter CbiM [Mesorhizobium sp.]|nr:cobalt transporter CbiM [Mesorhizobium sp.]MBL8579898.1 cobalt transporter CbiM [Mesorhizobium sp.]
MAHIADGILSLPVLSGASILAAAGVAYGLRQIDDRAIARISILSATFFAVSLVSVPVGPASVHLLLSALLGIILGPGIFLATVVALALQAVMFGFGGLTTLGVNTFNIAMPGFLVGVLVGPYIRRTHNVAGAAFAAALSAGLCVFLTGILVAMDLWLSSPDYIPVARIVLITYTPLAIGEALVCAAIVTFLKRANPDLLLPRLSSAGATT